MLRRIGCFLVSCAISLALISCGTQLASRESDAASLNAEKSYTLDAPVYESINQLAADADYIFQGVLTALEKVEGASWYWELYTIKDLYKGDSAQEQIRLVSSPEGSLPVHKVGTEYLVFATAYELPVYPYPLINPIYNQAIFEVGADGKLSIGGNVEEQMLPAVFDEQFAVEYRQILLNSAALAKINPRVPVVNEYTNAAEMLANSDVVVSVTFTEVEFINEYVSIGKVGKVTVEHGAAPAAGLPKSIALNEDVQAGEEYLIFLRYDAEEESLLLAARCGAIVRSSDMVLWNDTIQLLKKSS